MFVPDNDVTRNVWYWRDLDAMAAAALGPEAARAHQFMVDAEAMPAPPGGWPKGGATRLEQPNRHLEYALTWYGLAAAWSVCLPPSLPPVGGSQGVMKCLAKRWG
jgi:surfeit locus 1 family protein